MSMSDKEDNGFYAQRTVDHATHMNIQTKCPAFGFCFSDLNLPLHTSHSDNCMKHLH